MREQEKICDREGVDRALADHATVVRQALQRLPFDLCKPLAAETDPQKVREILQREIDDVCRKVSSMMRALPDVQSSTAQ